MEDQWKHRSDGMKCKTCMWFVPKPKNEPLQGTGKQEVIQEIIIDLGRCRRHSPSMSGYPAVFKTDWCGDHKMDENKI